MCIRRFYEVLSEPVNTIVGTPDLHGFVMVGSQTLFLCHLPMFFMENHKYQVILKVNLPDYAMRHYADDRNQHPDEVYILGNVPTDLMTLPPIHNTQLVAFIADIFRGVPKDPLKDTPLIHNVRVTIDRVVHFRHFDLTQDYPKALTYVLFGSGTEAHMAHYLTREPDFDHVLDLAEVPGWLPPAYLESGVNVSFPGLRSSPPYCSNPLIEPAYQVQFQGQEELYPIQIGTSFWFDTGGLNSKDPCAGH